jgi:hypothetical protein
MVEKKASDTRVGAKGNSFCNTKSRMISIDCVDSLMAQKMNEAIVEDSFPESDSTPITRRKLTETRSKCLKRCYKMRSAATHQAGNVLENDDDDEDLGAVAATWA